MTASTPRAVIEQALSQAMHPHRLPAVASHIIQELHANGFVIRDAIEADNTAMLAVLPHLLDHYLNCYGGNKDQLAIDAQAAIDRATRGSPK